MPRIQLILPAVMVTLVFWTASLWASCETDLEMKSQFLVQLSAEIRHSIEDLHTVGASHELFEVQSLSLQMVRAIETFGLQFSDPKASQILRKTMARLEREANEILLREEDENQESVNAIARSIVHVAFVIDGHREKNNEQKLLDIRDAVKRIEDFYSTSTNDSARGPLYLLPSSRRNSHQENNVDDVLARSIASLLLSYYNQLVKIISR